MIIIVTISHLFGNLQKEASQQLIKEASQQSTAEKNELQKVEESSKTPSTQSLPKTLSYAEAVAGVKNSSSQLSTKSKASNTSLKSTTSGPKAVLWSEIVASPKVCLLVQYVCIFYIV